MAHVQSVDVGAVMIDRHLETHAEAVPGIRTIAAGTFDDPSWLESNNYLCRHVYTRTKQSWTTIPDNVEQYEQHFR